MSAKHLGVLPLYNTLREIEPDVNRPTRTSRATEEQADHALAVKSWTIQRHHLFERINIAFHSSGVTALRYWCQTYMVRTTDVGVV